MGCSKDDTPEVKTRDVSFKVCVSCDDLIMNDYYGSTLVQSVHNRQVIIPLNQSALHWLPERNGCKPSQKVFELTILGVCNRYLKKNDCGCRDYEKCQFPYEPSHICRADTGCRKWLVHSRQVARTYEHKFNTGVCRCGYGNKGWSH